MRALAITVGFLTGLFSAMAVATDDAQADYMLNCQGCHLADGSGFPARQVPALRNEVGKFLAVAGGREFLVQVPGSAQSNLSDARLAAVLNWLLQEFSAEQLPADFQPYQVEEVHRLRQSPLLEVAQPRAELIEKILLAEQSAAMSGS
jgi:mono/diheme cytochrome c family protein